jgi:hypothetical protein
MMLSTDAMRLRMAAATRDLVTACGGVERAAGLASVSTSQVSRWQSAQHEDTIPLLAALALEADSGLPLVTAAMAAAHGRTLTDAASGAAAASVAHVMADVVGATGEVMARHSAAMADGRLTPAEAETLDRTVGALDRKVESLRQHLALVKCGGGA